MLIDSHCHLDLVCQQLNISIDELMKYNFDFGLQQLLAVATDINNTAVLLDYAKKYAKNIFVSSGVHPCYVGNKNIVEEFNDSYDVYLDHPSVVALGEMGLDYYHEHDKKNQRLFFEYQMQQALLKKLPIIVHSRQAKKDTLAMLHDYSKAGGTGVLHCYTEDLQMAESLIDLGFYISFSGIVTFANAKALKEIATMVPSNLLLIETDSPYLSPVPKRGKVNYPGFVHYVATYLAELRSESYEDFTAEVASNFHALFPKILLNHTT